MANDKLANRNENCGQRQKYRVYQTCNVCEHARFLPGDMKPVCTINGELPDERGNERNKFIYENSVSVRGSCSKLSYDSNLWGPDYVAALTAKNAEQAAEIERLREAMTDQQIACVACNNKTLGYPCESCGNYPRGRI